jgi:WD40 repeat protein
MPEDEGAEAEPARSIEAADISPDGSTLVTASLDGTLAEWDMETGVRRRVLFDAKRLKDENSRFFAVKDGREDNFPFYFSRLSEPMRGSSLLSVRFSPNGKYFAVGAANGYVVLWKARSRREIFGWWAASEAGVVALDISPDHKWMATGSLEEFGKPFRVWRLRGHLPDVRLAFCGEHHILGVWAVCFSPNGRIVAAGGWTMSGYNAPELFEVKSGKQVGALYWDITRALRFSPDGKMILTGGDFGDVKLWQVESKELVCEFKAHEDSVRAVGFSPGGKRFFSASRSEGVKIWETKEEESLIREFRIGRVLACRFAKDGRTLLAASANKGIDSPVVHRLTTAS